MRVTTRFGLALATVLAAAATSGTTPAEGKCAEGNCWDICEDALNRCIAADDGTDGQHQNRCFDVYLECTLECPM